MKGVTEDPDRSLLPAESRRTTDRYDVVIVGASFAGLAVASRLRGRVLLIDKDEVGGGQTSACGTLLAVPQRLGLGGTVLQIQTGLVFHLRDRTEVMNTHDYPFCTFDYWRFCREFAGRLDVEILRARALGVDGNSVLTDRGIFEAGCIVDASGWRAVIARCLHPAYADQRRMSYGIEAEVPSNGEYLCFWYDPTQVPRGVQWFFPCGSQVRVGVASYAGDAHLRGHLDIFTGSLEMPMERIHGGYFPAGLREPVVGNLFVVGDAAGQCLPFTGEGIRPALYFGQACGRIVQRVVDGQLSLEEGLLRYREFVGRHRWMYRVMSLSQLALLRLPVPVSSRLIGLICRDPLRSRLLPGYVRVADPHAMIPSASAGRRKTKGSPLLAS
ncbi:MAG TPA: NAD(P)/FAD-dependent oxidoreductase [Candidatus Methylomirabilis sp.]|nr:NAD(P)/FAD-dependent oxidoreductase [Candidatus Methylomirabilis sp.]HSD50668.1 NAD(P)/FAD-dependent oxidoreductase [Candidatus Methylomirabilis sp.]